MTGLGKADGARQRLRRAAPVVVLAAVFAVLPALSLDANTIKLLFLTFVWTTASIGWNTLGGFTGQVSFGFAVFFGLGAYTTALAINAGASPYATFPLAALVAVVASLLIGLPTFRLRGPYFAIATIGVSEAVRVIMSDLAFTGGASGYRIVEHRPFHQTEHYYTALVLVALAVWISIRVRHSRFGLGLRAIRDDEDAAADTGVNPFAYKLASHAVAAGLAGAAGGVYARYAAFIHPGGVFAFHTSIVILLMPIIGGLNTIWGPVIGGAVYGVIEEELVANFPGIHLLLYGALVILVILFEPGGVMGLVGRLSRAILKRKEASWLPS
jgi:branched-chain amino acid transport system permease protein